MNVEKLNDEYEEYERLCVSQTREQREVLAWFRRNQLTAAAVDGKWILAFSCFENAQTAATFHSWLVEHGETGFMSDASALP